MPNLTSSVFVSRLPDPENDDVAGSRESSFRLNSVILVFIDGLGVGVKDPTVNPLAAFRPRVLNVYEKELGPFPQSGRCLATDAQLGVEGLPQSATGQTTLVTGLNAPSLVGRHLPGFPGPTLRRLIERHSIFNRLRAAGFKVTFANSFTPEFFQRRPRWVSVTTVMCEAAEVKLWQLDDLLAGRSLFMDFTNRMLQDRGYDVPVRTPKQAARILLRMSRQYHLCFYEYFLTDLVGHRGNLQQAVSLLTELDRFLFELVTGADLSHTSIVVTSDHGNIEQMNQKQHTSNPVPTILWGAVKNQVNGEGDDFSLSEVAPLIERFLTQVTREVE